MLTKKEFDILVLLTESKEPMSQREIAEALGISLGAVNKAMQEQYVKFFLCQHVVSLII